MMEFQKPNVVWEADSIAALTFYKINNTVV